MALSAGDAGSFSYTKRQLPSVRLHELMGRSDLSGACGVLVALWGPFLATSVHPPHVRFQQVYPHCAVMGQEHSFPSGF